MKATTIALTLGAVTFLTSCSLRGIRGDGNITSETRTVAEFSSLEATSAFDIQWTSSPAGLLVTTDQNLLAHIKTDVSGDKLRIFPDASISATKGIKVVVSSASLKNITVTGAVHLTANGISGNELKITSTGAGSIDASGDVTSLTVDLTGASELKAPKLNARITTITLVGASSADIVVTERIKASITGAGSLTYSGSPSSVEQSVTGAGTIRNRR